MDDRRILMMTHDDELLDDLLRLAAAAGCELLRVPDAAAARPPWQSAPLVLLDEQAAQACAKARLPRRPGVVVLGRQGPAPTVWPAAMAVGAEHVIALPDAESWLVSTLADAAEGHRRSGRVLAVVGGRGGAGASVLAAAVALAALAGGERVMLVDCDPLGGGLDLVLGAEHTAGLRWPDLTLTGGRVPAASLHDALPAVGPGRRQASSGELSVLSYGRSDGGPSPNAVAAVLDSGRRAGETVVCDLPRYPTDGALAVLDAADLTVLIVPAEVRSCAAAARVARVLTERGAMVQLVVRGPAPGGLAARDVATSLGLPLLAAMRPQPGLAGSLDRGTGLGSGRGPLATAAATVLAELHGRAEARLGSGDRR